MSRRPKIANQPQKTPLTPEAQDIKQAIQQTQLYPIEQVVYLTDSNHVQHTSGTNRYTIPFPETWRTLANTDLYIGVRSIGLHNVPKRTIRISFRCTAGPERPISQYASATEVVNWEYAYQSEPSVASWLTAWNTILDTVHTKLYDRLKYLQERHWPRHQWFYQLNPTTKQHVFAMHMLNSTGEIADIIDDSTVYRDWDIVVDGMSEVTVSRHRVESRNKDNWSWLVTMTFPAAFVSHDEYLLSASFVNQTRWNYLGFTNTVFNPPKIYKINNNDTHYWIELASPDGLEQRELPVDRKDFITLEIQLIAQPISHRL